MWLQNRRLTGYWRLLLALAIIVSAVAVVGPWFWRVVYPIPHRSLVEKYARANGLDVRLVAAVIKVESNFRSDATSPKDARGLMQILPSTGAWIATQIGLAGFNDSKLYEPETNLRLGCWYLNDLIVQFDGQLHLALAAYNGGRGNVQKWLNDGTWSGKEIDISQIPFAETRSYVWKVMRVYAVYLELYPASP